MMKNYRNHTLPVTKYYLRPPVFEVGYHARTEIYVIGVVFRISQCTRVHRLGFQNAQYWGKACVFWSWLQIVKKRWRKMNNNKTCKNAHLWSVFTPVKYVLRVCFESSFSKTIDSLKHKWPSLPGMYHYLNKSFFKIEYHCHHRSFGKKYLKHYKIYLRRWHDWRNCNI